MNIIERIKRNPLNKYIAQKASNGLQTISEVKLINRNYIMSSVFQRLQNYFDLYAASPTIDESKVNYFLARALYKGTVITDDKGIKYGSEYLLSAPFAKPIVNAIAAFLLNNIFKVAYEDGQFEGHEDYVNSWIESRSTDIFKLLVKSMTEGDSYVLIKNEFDAPLVRLKPELVEKVVNPADYTDVWGYNVSNIVYEGNGIDNEGQKKIMYKTLYRKYAPYVVTIRSEKANDHVIVNVDGNATEQPYTNPNFYSERFALIDDFDDLFNVNSEERPLPIVHFPNEMDEQSIYGESEYRNLYFLFLRYHQVFDNAIKNNVFNSVSTPYVSGITNMDAFLKENGVFDKETGTYKFDLRAGKMVMGGEGFDIRMIQSASTVESAEKLLNLIFWLIVQASEIPEFVFGTAVQSTNASVNNQMPVMVRKVKKKQKEFYNPVKELVESAVYYMGINGNTGVKVGDFKVVWGDILGDDMESRIKLVNLLDSLGLATDRTKGAIVGLDKYVASIDQEIENAGKEARERFEQFEYARVKTPEEVKEAEKEVKEMIKSEQKKVDIKGLVNNKVKEQMEATQSKLLEVLGDKL